MAVNAGRSGHEYPAYIYEVCREKVDEYAGATYLWGEALWAPDMGSGFPLVPPTFAACITGRVIPMVVDDPELDGHWNLLHTAQSFVFHRPVRVGDVLRCRSRITDITSRRDMDRLTLAVDVTDVDGDQPVLEATSTLVFFDPRES